MTRELSGGDTKAVKKALYKGETESGEVVGKVINSRKSYNIAFQIGVTIYHKNIN